MRVIGVAAALAASLSAGCGEVARNGRSPVLAVITALRGASGAEDSPRFENVLSSDVITVVEGVPTIFSDPGQVNIRLQLRDPGIPGVPSAPSSMNDVTFTRYRVTYSRADGRNTPGVDVPYPFDSALTMTVPAGASADMGFVLVRHTAKGEAPLAALQNSPVIISTIAEVTFYGRDQAGNEVMATGSIGVFFGNFGDPE